MSVDLLVSSFCIPVSHLVYTPMHTPYFQDSWSVEQTSVQGSRVKVHTPQSLPHRRWIVDAVTQAFPQLLQPRNARLSPGLGNPGTHGIPIWQGGLSWTHWHYAQEMKNASRTDSSHSCLLKISNSFFREWELFLIAWVTWQQFPKWLPQLCGLAGSWVHGDSRGSCKCHLSRSEFTKPSVRPRARVGKFPDNGKQEPVFSCLLLKHSCVSQNPVGITDTSDRKPLRSLSLFPGCLEGITCSGVVFWNPLVLTFACITFCFQFYYVNMFQKIKRGCVNLFWLLNVSISFICSSYLV